MQLKFHRVDHRLLAVYLLDVVRYYYDGLQILRASLVVLEAARQDTLNGCHYRKRRLLTLNNSMARETLSWQFCNKSAASSCLAIHCKKRHFLLAILFRSSTISSNSLYVKSFMHMAMEFIIVSDYLLVRGSYILPLGVADSIILQVRN